MERTIGKQSFTGIPLKSLLYLYPCKLAASATILIHGTWERCRQGNGTPIHAVLLCFSVQPPTGLFYVTILLGRVAGEVGTHRTRILQIEHFKNRVGHPAVLLLTKCFPRSAHRSTAGFGRKGSGHPQGICRSSSAGRIQSHRPWKNLNPIWDAMREWGEHYPFQNR